MRRLALSAWNLVRESDNPTGLSTGRPRFLGVRHPNAPGNHLPDCGGEFYLRPMHDRQASGEIRQEVLAGCTVAPPGRPIGPSPAGRAVRRGSPCGPTCVPRDRSRKPGRAAPEATARISSCPMDCAPIHCACITSPIIAPRSKTVNSGRSTDSPTGTSTRIAMSFMGAACRYAIGMGARSGPPRRSTDVESGTTRESETRPSRAVSSGCCGGLAPVRGAG